MMTEEKNPSQDLFGTSDLLKRYGITDAAFRTWFKRYGFPPPSVIINARVRYWSLSAILEWERTRTAANTEAA